jgi:hypothetical protein
VLSSNSLQELPCTPDSVALRELRLDGNRIHHAAGVASAGGSGPRFRLLELSGNPLSDCAETAECLGRVCMQLEVLSLGAPPVGLDPASASATQAGWAAALHHLPRLKTLNGQKWKRDKSKAPARSRPEDNDNGGGEARVEQPRPQQLINTTCAAATKEAVAVRGVLGALSRDQLESLMKAVHAGVDLAEELRRQNAATTDGDDDAAPPGSKRRARASTVCSSNEGTSTADNGNERSAGRPDDLRADANDGGRGCRDEGGDSDSSSKLMSTKAVARLQKKFGRAPTAAEIEAWIARKEQRQKKKKRHKKHTK